MSAPLPVPSIERVQTVAETTKDKQDAIVLGYCYLVDKYNKTQSRFRPTCRRYVSPPRLN